MTVGFPYDPVQTAIAVAYHNPRYIADQILPRVQVGAEKFKWHEWPIEETFRAPDTTAGRRGRLNEVQLSLIEHDSSTKDYGLAASVPYPDQSQAGLIPGYDPVGQMTQQLAEYVLLDREIRASNLVFAAAAYPTANKIQLSGNDRWDIAHADSDPIEDILAGMDAMLTPPNTLLLGFAAWQALRKHPVIIRALNGSDAGDKGIANTDQIARLFMLDRVLIGTPRLNSAKFGQTASLVRVWGPHCLLAHINPTATADGQMLTFGLTAQWGARVANTEAVAPGRMGLRGGTSLTVGESVKELVIAASAAYFLEDVVG